MPNLQEHNYMMALEKTRLKLEARVQELEATNQTLRQKVSNLRTRVQGLEEFISHHNYNVSDAYDWIQESITAD
jgi:cell division protein FtsB